MVRRCLLLVLLVVALVVPAAPGAHAVDYQQVVDLTFPFTEDVDVYYTDSYDACRSGCSRRHQATDLMVALGTPVHAVVGGTVSFVSGDANGPASWGWHIEITGIDGRTYDYIHLGEQDGPRDEAYAPGITKGAKVDRGQLIGWAGCSGNASCGGGEHLHLEIHDPDVVDPYGDDRINPVHSLRDAEKRGDYPGHRFKDVSSSSPHAADIETLAEAGLTKGCNAAGTRFCPKDKVTRAQMASFLVSALGLTNTSERGEFLDVSSKSVFAEDINRLATEGITVGCNPEGDHFCPDKPVNRAAMATFLARAVEEVEPRDPWFTDVQADDIHGRDIGGIAHAGIARGCSSDGPRYCPGRRVTRAQMSSFLVRAFLE